MHTCGIKVIRNKLTVYAKFRTVVTWWSERGRRREKQLKRGIKGASKILVMLFSLSW